MNDLNRSDAPVGACAVVTEFKFSDSKGPGYFEGYGAIYGNIDRGGDLIEPGAFAKSLHEINTKGYGMPPMYYNHDQRGGTIGVWEKASEDSKGLEMAGRIIGLDAEFGKMNYARVREGAVKGMSIGFRIPPGGYKRGTGKGGEPLRYLKQINLAEVSLVDDPMNPLARVSFIKSNSLYLPEDLKAGDIKSPEHLASFLMQNIPAIALAVATKGWKDAIRDYENLLLRDVAGFSREAAKSIAVTGFRDPSDPRDEAEKQVALLVERMKNFQFK